MKNSVVLTLLFLAVFAAPAQPHTINGIFDYEKACQVMKVINSERQGKGLAPLNTEPALTEAAMLRAAEFAYRVEVEQVYTFAPDYEDRPNKDDNLTLIGEQRHTKQPKVEYVSIYMEHDLYTPNAYNGFNRVPSFLKKKDKSGAFFSNKMQSIGCGAFISPEGFYYWVVFLLPDKGAVGEIPNGQWTTEVGIGTSHGEQTRTLTRSKSDTDLTPSSVEISGTFNFNKAIEVVELTNKERVANGLKPCKMDSVLMELAMIRAAEIKALGRLSHVCPNGQRGEDIIDMYWDSGWGIVTRENLGWGYDGLPSTLVERWMHSPGHRDAILDAECDRMGAGVCDGYWVQLFAKYDKNAPYLKKAPALSKSSGHIDEVTVRVTVVYEEMSKVLRRKRVE